MALQVEAFGARLGRRPFLLSRHRLAPITKTFTGGWESSGESLPISHWSNHSSCIVRIGRNASGPKSASVNGSDMLCGHGPTTIRFRPDVLRKAA